MGRKYKNQRRKKQNKEQSPEPEKKIKSEQPYHLFNKSERRNLFFEEFYRITLKEDFDAKNDFEAFKSICKERLPVSFRINSTAPNYQAFQAMLKDKSKIASIQLDDHKNSKRKKETTEED